MTKEVSKETQELMDSYTLDADTFYEIMNDAADNFGGDTMKEELDGMIAAYSSYDLSELGMLMYNEIEAVMRRKAEES